MCTWSEEDWLGVRNSIQIEIQVRVIRLNSHAVLSGRIDWICIQLQCDLPLSVNKCDLAWAKEQVERLANEVECAICGDTA